MNITIESGAFVQFTDKPININHFYGDVVQQNIVQVENCADKQDENLHFPLNNTKDEGIRIFEALTQKHFMEGALDSWLYLLGFSDQKPNRLILMKWLGTKEQLRVMLRLIFEKLVKEGSLSVAGIERLTPHCFTDKNGKPMKLAKPKEENSFEMDTLTEIIRPKS